MKHLLFKDGDFKKEIKKLSTKRVVKKLANFPISTVDLFDVTEIPVLTETDVASFFISFLKSPSLNNRCFILINQNLCLIKNVYNNNYSLKSSHAIRRGRPDHVNIS